MYSYMQFNTTEANISTSWLEIHHHLDQNPMARLQKLMALSTDGCKEEYESEKIPNVTMLVISVLFSLARPVADK